MQPAPSLWLQRADERLRARGYAADTVIAIGFALALGIPATVTLHDMRLSTIWTITAVAAALGTHAAVVWRRHHPAFAFAVTCVGMLALAAGPTGRLGDSTGPLLYLPTTVMFLPALYSYTAFGTRTGTRFALAGGIGGVAIVALRVTSDEKGDNRPEGAVQVIFLVAALTAGVLAAWGFGLYRRTQRAYVEALEERARRAEAEREERARRAAVDERTRIAADMHDVVAHSLAVIVTQAEGGQYAAEADPGRAVGVLSTVASTARTALNDVRALLGVLNHDDGATRDPQPMLADLPELVERVRRSGIDVGHRSTGMPFTVGASTELAVYRLVQESLTNVLKHAPDGVRVVIDLDWGVDALEVSVVDDGAGARVAQPESGRGLNGMRERVALVGGAVTAQPGTDAGFAVRAHIPRAAGSVAGA